MRIIVDTREKKNIFLFKSYADVEIIIKGIPTGDYMVEGLAQKVVIDRKASVGELYLNLGSQFVRFKKELDRMRDIEFAYFLCCFPYSYLDTFPENSGIPKSKWKKLVMGGSFLRKKIKDIEEEYPNIKFIFCNNHIEGESIAYQILKEHTGGQET
jgi:hypothetical protein